MDKRTPDAAVAAAIDRVLAAEAEAAAAITSAQKDADGLIEAARGRRREILDSARRRASRMHARAQEQLRKALDELDVQSAAPGADVDALRIRFREALGNLARRLTSADHEPH